MEIEASMGRDAGVDATKRTLVIFMAPKDRSTLARGALRTSGRTVFLLVGQLRKLFRAFRLFIKPLLMTLSGGKRWPFDERR